MGGNLFKAGRISKEKYLEIIASLKPVLDKQFGDRYRIPVAYKNKIDYGDVDIILDAAVVLNKSKWKDELAAELGVTEVKKIRNVFSMLYQNFQVDVFLVGTNELETCFNFMSYNILGNLIGRIYHKFNLRYGETGLFYVLRGFNNHISKEIVVSRDMKQILEFIGLSYDRWTLGFDDVEDVFEYVIESPYFTSNSYDLKYFNVQKRAVERPDFNKFLDYISDNEITKNYPFNKNKEVYLPMIDEYFGTGLLEKYLAHVIKQEQVKIISDKFNGRIIKGLIPDIDGKELGAFINHFKQSYSNFEENIIQLSQENINNEILNSHNKWKKI